MVVEPKTTFSFERRSASIVERKGNPKLSILSTLQRTNLVGAIRSTDDTSRLLEKLEMSCRGGNGFERFEISQWIWSCRYRQSRRVCCLVNQLLARASNDVQLKFSSCTIWCDWYSGISHLILVLMQEAARPLRTGWPRASSASSTRLGETTRTLTKRGNMKWRRGERLSWIGFSRGKLRVKTYPSICSA